MTQSAGSGGTVAGKGARPAGDGGMDPAVRPAPAGEAAELIAGLGWDNFPLGPFAAWPAALRTAINMMLASRFPMFIAWGPDLPYLYNDACIPIVGARHPAAFGRPFREVWPDVWDDLSPLMDQALQGEASYHENLPLLLVRDGVLQPAWFTFSYSPLFDADGTIHGVLSVAVESTRTFLADQLHALQGRLVASMVPLEEPAAIIGAAADVLVAHLGAGRSGYAEVDRDGAVTTAVDRHQPGFALLPAHYRLADIGQPIVDALSAGKIVRIDDAAADPRLTDAGRQVLSDLGVGAVMAAPLVKEGRLAAVVHVAQREPRAWTGSDEEALREVSERSWSAIERARAEQRVKEGERELRQLTDALPVLISHVDSAGRYRFNNRAYEEWFGHPREEILGKTLREVLGEAAWEGLGPAVERALAGEAMSIEQRVPYKDGGERYIHVDYVPRHDSGGRPEGFYALVQDIGEQKRAEEALRRSEQRLRAVLESVSDGFFALDAELRFTLFNRACEAHMGLSRDQVLGRRLEDVFPALSNSPLEKRLAAVLSSGTPRTFEADSPALAGHVIEVRAAPKDGGGIAVSFSDITERRRAETLRQLLVNELNHRVKNTLAVVQGLAAQSLKPGIPPHVAKRALEGRLRALAAAHDVLTARNWAGAALHAVVTEAILTASDPTRFQLDGPAVELPPQTAVTLAIALHELCTNAVKYGALGVPAGHVQVHWSVVAASETASGQRLQLVWQEFGGPPVAQPAQRGFGSRMLEQGLAGELDGSVRLEFATQGLVCRIDAPLPEGSKAH